MMQFSLEKLIVFQYHQLCSLMVDEIRLLNQEKQLLERSSCSCSSLLRVIAQLSLGFLMLMLSLMLLYLLLLQRLLLLDLHFLPHVSSGLFLKRLSNLLIDLIVSRKLFYCLRSQFYLPSPIFRLLLFHLQQQVLLHLLFRSFSQLSLFLLLS